jgi:predicted nucleic acid-binding protein
LRDGNVALLGKYDIAFSSRELRLIELDFRVIDQATAIRATESVKTADALHIAAAMVGGATVFLTGDTQLIRVSRIQVELI